MPAAPAPTPAPAPAPALRRLRLDNGLRVILDPRPATSRVAVSVHYGVGFRSEEPGEAGLAHLFEHLMFRGSASLPAGRFYDHVHALGGYANGTTHQDYTDYYQVLAASGLTRALFAEADRMRTPLFTPGSVREQIIGVGQEIDQVTRDRPFGGFPWPLLPGVLFDDFAHAHDGYGHVDQLASVTPEVCQRFFDRYYAPGNAVLTVSGGIGIDETVELVHRLFDDIPCGACEVALGPLPPAPSTDRVAEYGETGVDLRATAVGYRIDGYDIDPDGYLDQLVLGRLLSGQSRRTAGPRFDASAGFFGPLDARTPEVAVLVTAGDPALPAAGVVGHLDRLLAGWTDGGAPDAAATVADAVRELRIEHRSALDDLLPRARMLGRFELLFGGADRAAAVDDRLAAVDPERVGRAAGRLQESPRAVLTLRPASVRTRPPTPPVAEVPATGSRRSREADRRPRRVPELAAGPADRAAVPVEVGQESEVATGEPFLWVRRPDGPVELRARWSLTPTGWARPERVQQVLGAVDRDRAAGLGSPALRSDGQWVTLSARCLPGDLQALTAEVRALLDSFVRHEQAPSGADAPRAWPAWLGAEFALADQVARTATDLAGEAGPRAGGGDGPRRGTLLDVGSGAVVLVAPDLPASVRRALTGAFGALGAPASPRPGRSARCAEPDPAGSDHLVLVPTAPGGHRELTLAVPDDRHAMHDPARYLATAVLGGYARSRLTRRAAGRPDPAFRLFAGYDRVAGTSRSVVRATVPPAPAGPGADPAGDPLATALQDIHDVLAEWDRDPVTDDELVAARRYCAAQLPLAVDSAAGCADLLVHLLTTGGDVDTLRSAPERLWTVPADEVRRAGRRLTGGSGGPVTLVVVGPPDGVVEQAARHGYHLASPATPVG